MANRPRQYRAFFGNNRIFRLEDAVQYLAADLGPPEADQFGQATGLSVEGHRC